MLLALFEISHQYTLLVRYYEPETRQLFLFQLPGKVNVYESL